MKMMRMLSALCLAFVSAPASALFDGSDFLLTVEGEDSGPPYVNLGAFGPAYEFYLTNLSDETATFRSNIFMTGFTLDGVSLNGVDIFDSPHYEWWFSAVDPYPSNGSVAPGETMYFGGLAIYLDFFTVPNVSTVIFESFSLKFRNEPGGEIFQVDYEGPPLVNTLVTPVPAVGYGLLPLLLIMGRVFRKPA